MHILFLTPYPPGQAPSQRFRFEQYLTLLEQRGFQVSCQSFWNEKTWAILYKPGHTFQKALGFIGGKLNRWLMLFQLRKVDFLFIHRECLPIGPPVIEWVIAKILKKKIIYDFDDAIWLPNTSKENKLVAFLKCHSKVASICKWSYKVSCGNQYLYDFAKSYNQTIVLNPTTIDTEHVHNPHLIKANQKNDVITIGWTGTHSTLKYLEGIQSVLNTLDNQFSGKIKFLIISNKRPSLEISSLEYIEWSKETEIEDLVKMDIGIMPLSDDQWAKGKCGFKALQYMALEIPAVATPVGVNTAIIDTGINGYLCKSETEWLECLKKLITNKALRNEIGIAGRKKVEMNYSVSSNLSTFLSLFDLDKINNRAVNKNGRSGIL